MRRLLALLLTWAVLAAALPGAGADGPAETPEARKKRLEAVAKEKAKADREFAARVNAAIDKGHAYLKGAQRGDGGWTFPVDDRQNLGRVALVLLTLVKCGSDAGDPEIRRGLEALLPLYEARRDAGEFMTYSVAVTLLFFDALYNPPPAKSDDRYAAPARKRCKYPKEIEEKIREMVRWLVEKQTETVWRYPGGLGEGVAQDLSNTQYALLALQAAGRCGIEAPASTYRKALEYLLKAQEPDGPDEPRWIENPAYDPGNPEDRYGPFMPGGKSKARGWRYLDQPGIAVTGSMTTAGVAGLAIVKERLQALGVLEKETTGRIDRAMVDGLAWLSRNFAVDANPGQGGWHYYYLYGLERVGAYTGQTFVGKHDWYREGAEYLLRAQQGDGSWPGAGDHEDLLVQTCFALLFLRRATVPPATPLGPVVTDGN